MAASQSHEPEKMSDPMNDDPTMPDDDDARDDILAAELSLGLL